MAEPQLGTVAEPSIFQQVKALAKPPIVRMDRSRDFATVHGERMVGDPHADVFFTQDGLPFGSTGNLLWQREEVQNNPKLKAKAERLLKRALKLLKEAPGDQDEDEDEEEELDEIEDEEEEREPINLSEWASGKEYLWQEVSNCIARRYHVRVQNKRAAIELLIKENVTTEAALTKAYRKLLAD